MHVHLRGKLQSIGRGQSGADTGILFGGGDGVGGHGRGLPLPYHGVYNYYITLVYMVIYLNAYKYTCNEH